MRRRVRYLAQTLPTDTHFILFVELYAHGTAVVCCRGARAGTGGNADGGTARARGSTHARARTRGGMFIRARARSVICRGVRSG